MTLHLEARKPVLTPTSAGRRTRPGSAAVAVVLGLVVATAVAALRVTADGQSRMLPWILGRGLGLAGFGTLVALSALGLWLRHPWRLQRPRVSPEIYLRVHAALAGCTLVLVIGHIAAIVLDRYAGVGLTGALVPGHSSYRPTGVALGTVATYAGLLAGGPAALAGRLVRRAWLPIHRLAILSVALVWAHGLLAGSDSRSLRLVYFVTAVMVGALWLTRQLASNDSDVRT